MGYSEHQVPFHVVLHNDFNLPKIKIRGYLIVNRF